MKEWQRNLAASLWTSTAGQAENTCRAGEDKLPPERWKENNKRRGETEKMDFMVNILSDQLDCPIFLTDYFLFWGFSVEMCVCQKELMTSDSKNVWLSYNSNDISTKDNGKHETADLEKHIAAWKKASSTCRSFCSKNGPKKPSTFSKQICMLMLVWSLYVMH